MATVQNYPQLLTSTTTSSLDPTLTGQRVQTYGYNELSPEYTKGYENKLALYFTDNWQVTPQFNIYYGGRLEYYRMSADQISASVSRVSASATLPLIAKRKKQEISLPHNAAFIPPKW